MEHFYQNIHGFFDFQEIYSSVVRHFPNNSHFVEVGAWKGTSSAFMAVEIINSGKNIKFDVVDTWLGSLEHLKGQIFEDQDVIDGKLYEVFLKNINPVRHIINPIRLPSTSAATLYADNSLDFVFIDADHSYEGVKNDINTWSNKVKIGGFLSGHDYYGFPGVRQAVDEMFNTPEVYGNSWLVRRVY